MKATGSRTVRYLAKGEKGDPGENGQDGKDGTDGKDGQDGKDGADAVSYRIEFSQSAAGGTASPVQSVACDAYGNPKGGSTLAATLYRTVGGTEEEYPATVYLAAFTTAGALTQQAESGGAASASLTIAAGEAYYYAEASDPDTRAAITSATLYKTYDGSAGQQGIEGCVYRQTQWEEGKEYRNDAGLDGPAEGQSYRYVDVAGIQATDGTAYWFQCLQTHTADSSNAPQAGTTTTYWRPLNNLQPTYTPLLLADNAELALIGTRQILVKETDGTISLGITGRANDEEGNDSGVRLWVGPSALSGENTLVVFKDGTLMTRGTFAAKAEDLGNITGDDPGSSTSSVPSDYKMYEPFTRGIYNFYATAQVSGSQSDERYLRIPDASVYNTSNLFQLRDGVEFSLLHIPRPDADGVVESGLLRLGAANDIYAPWQYAGSSSISGYTYAWNTEGRVQSLLLPPYGMARLRAFRVPVYTSAGVATGSYDICWMLLNAQDFEPEKIQLTLSGGAVNATLHLKHRLCGNPADPEDEGVATQQVNF